MDARPIAPDSAHGAEASTMIGRSRLKLDGGDWQLRGCLGREWEWHVGPDRPWDAPGWIPARVPGSVLDDLMRAGEVPWIYHERASRLAEWVPERAWVYRRRIPASAAPAVLRFEGVDYACTVLLDGHEVATHEGCFTPFEIELDGAEHLLAVVVHPAPESEPQVGATSRVRVHKSRMGYGWDFCPRIIHQGIWRPVTVGEPRLEPGVTLSDGEGVIEAPGRIALLDGGELVAEGEDELRLPSPALWSPDDPHLYRLHAGARAVDVGFRRVELDGGSLVVNGRRETIRGWNWVPVDALYGVPRPERLAHLLRLAKAARVNLLRVWGGGLIETDEFYALCDRLGILVWQEFSMSSSGMESVPSDDPAFVARIADEARRIVPRLRHHPSLAVWCGGNELDGDDSTPVLGALHDVVRELDPGRAWRPTSPIGDDEHGPWEHQGLGRHYEHYDARTCALHSEFGVEGMTNRRALAALIEPAHRWPADRTNPVYEHLGAWWNNAPLVQECFGGRLDDVDALRRASQWLQYDGLRYAVEASLRRSCGTIPWQLNESYPNAWCTAAIDWHGEPKPAYWGVRRAYRPAHACARFATCAWGGREEVRAQIFAWGGAEAAGRLGRLDGSVVAEGAGEVAAPLAELTDVFLLDLGCNRYVMTRTDDLAPLLDLPPARVTAEASAAGLELSCDGPVAAIGIVLEGARTLADNVIDLLPGESRTIAVEWDGAVLVAGWNVEALRCSR
jgi:beta-mannosidase